jgi:hypothetical protein
MALSLHSDKKHAITVHHCLFFVLKMLQDVAIMLLRTTYHNTPPSQDPMKEMKLHVATINASAFSHQYLLLRPNAWSVQDCLPPAHVPACQVPRHPA